jgi:hypothetical protein
MALCRFLPENLHIVGFGRSAVPDEELRNKIKDKLSGTEKEKAKFLKCVCRRTKRSLVCIYQCRFTSANTYYSTTLNIWHNICSTVYAGTFSICAWHSWIVTGETKTLLALCTSDYYYYCYY